MQKKVTQITGEYRKLYYYPAFPENKGQVRGIEVIAVCIETTPGFLEGRLKKSAPAALQ